MAKATVKQQILMLLNEKGSARYSDFVHATGRPDRTVYIALQDLQRLGWVAKNADKLYEITQAGRRELQKMEFETLRGELEKMRLNELRDKMSFLTLMEIDWGSFVSVLKSVLSGTPIKEYKKAPKLLDGLEISTNLRKDEGAEILLKNVIAALLHYISSHADEEFELRVSYTPPKQLEKNVS